VTILPSASDPSSVMRTRCFLIARVFPRRRLAWRSSGSTVAVRTYAEARWRDREAKTKPEVDRPGQPFMERCGVPADWGGCDRGQDEARIASNCTFGEVGLLLGLLLPQRLHQRPLLARQAPSLFRVPSAVREHDGLELVVLTWGEAE
jgi:hypothetical protein